MSDFVPETSDDRNSAKTNTTDHTCEHCRQSFDTDAKLSRHKPNCPEKGD